MHKKLNVLILLPVLLAGLTSCGPTTSERMAAQETAITTPEGVVLLFEEAYTSSSATGKCISFVTHRWYGAERPFEDVLLEHEAQLETAGWVYEEQGYVMGWYKEDDRGWFRAIISNMSDRMEEVDSYSSHYTISDEQLVEIEGYPTIYIINLNYVSFLTIRKCYSD